MSFINVYFQQNKHEARVRVARVHPVNLASCATTFSNLCIVLKDFLLPFLSFLHEWIDLTPCRGYE